jgi:hypothetical protein
MQLVRRQSGYEEFLADRVWRTMLPIVSYIAVLVSAVVLFADGDVALYMVAGAGLALLFAAVHNAWDSAIWISSEHD